MSTEVTGTIPAPSGATSSGPAEMSEEDALTQMMTKLTFEHQDISGLVNKTGSMYWYRLVDLVRMLSEQRLRYTKPTGSDWLDLWNDVEHRIRRWLCDHEDDQKEIEKVYNQFIADMWSRIKGAAAHLEDGDDYVWDVWYDQAIKPPSISKTVRKAEDDLHDTKLGGDDDHKVDQKPKKSEKVSKRRRWKKVQ